MSTSNPTMRDDVLAFIARFDSLMLATSGADGADQQAESSIVPFAYQRGEFLLLLSELAPHTGNLLTVPKASLSLCDTTRDNRNAFAKDRLICAVSAKEVTRGTDAFLQHIECMHQHLGPTVEVLEALPDFHAFSLRPTQMRWITGFAKTYISTTGALTDLSPVTADSLSNEA